jgi:Tol biopolymer transport system component
MIGRHARLSGSSQAVATALLALGVLFPTVCFAQPRMSVYVMNDDGTDVKFLFKVPGHNWHGSHAWSKDSKRIATDAYPENLSAAKIFMTAEDGSDLQDLGYGVRPDFSPDGKQIAFFGLEPDRIGLRPGVWITNTDGNGRVWLCEGTSPRWSPDGSLIAITRNHANNNAELVLYDVAEGKERSLFSGKYTKLSGSSWSPEGKQIAVHCFVGSEGRLTIIPLDDPAKSKVVHKGNYGDHCPAWCPDGKRMALCQGENAQLRIFMINLETDDPPVYLTKLSDGEINADPTWSPDGKRLVFGSNRGT